MWHRVGAAGGCLGAVLRFLDRHSLQNFAAARVGVRQFTQMIFEVSFDLVFSFLNETQAAPIARKTGECAETETAREPHGRQSAGRAAELAEPLRTPGEVIVFFLCSVDQMPPRSRRSRKKRLPVVQRLRGDFAGMIDAHQAYAVLAGFGVHGGVVRVPFECVERSARQRFGEAGTQGFGGPREGGIEQAVSGGHLRQYSGCIFDAPWLSLRA